MSSLTPNQRMVAYVEKTAAALDLAHAAEQAKEASDQRVAALAPLAVKSLIDAGLLDPAHEKQACARLRDHASAVEILQKIAERVQNTTEALGTPVAPVQKKASDSLTGPFVGSRHTGPRASDEALLRGLLGNR